MTALFCISTIKNISYPLLWNDEAETALFASRILQFGYPKVNDGHNSLYLLGETTGIDLKHDSYVGSVWGQYYFAAAGVLLAKYFDNLYVKTFIVRLPFAIIGIIGILIFSLSLIDFTRSLKTKLFMWALFMSFEMVSIPLILHLREARYYSLLIFLYSCAVYLYVRFSVNNKPQKFIYTFAVTLLLFLIYNTFPPAYFAFVAALFLFEIRTIGKPRQFLAKTLPIYVSLAAIMSQCYF